MILDEHDLLAGLDVALNEIFKTMILRGGAHIDKGHSQRVGNKGTMRDGSCGNAGNNLGVTEVLHDEPGHLHLDEVAHLGIGQGHSQVGIYGGLPTCSPSEGTIGLQLDGINMNQFLSEQSI